MPAKPDGDPSPDVDDIPDWAIELKPCDNFGPAASSVDNVFGCAKPDSLRIDEWIEFVREKGVSRIVVLTEIDSSGYDGYYEKFLEEFEEENVCQAPVADRQLCETELLNEKIIPFINTSIENEDKVVVHCSAGMGRTGHVLAAWLYSVNTLTVEKALTAVRKVPEEIGRIPDEAVSRGNATEEELHDLIRSTRKESAALKDKSEPEEEVEENAGVENVDEQAEELAALTQQAEQRRVELLATAEQLLGEQTQLDTEVAKKFEEYQDAEELLEIAVGEEDIRDAELAKDTLAGELETLENVLEEKVQEVLVAQAATASPEGTLQLGEDWLDDLDSSSLDSFGCLFELLDNSIFHKEEHVPINIEIKLHMKEDQNAGDLVEKIEIIDNGSGIDSSIIFAAISPWGRKGLNEEENPSEHGMGMKYGISGLGKQFTLKTKTRTDSHAKIATDETCRKMVQGTPVSLDEEVVNWDHGTRITITNCNEKGHKLGFRAGSADTLRDAALEISNRYRRHIPDVLHPDNFSLNRIDHQGEIIHEYSIVSGYEPIYCYNPFQNKMKEAIIKEFSLKPDDGTDRWEAELTFGIAPSEKEWESNRFTNNMRENRNRQYDLYKVKTAGGGFDIVYKDIVLQREYLTKDKSGGLPGIIKSHPSNNRLRGVIDLKSGFSSRTEKIGVKGDRHFHELSELIEKILTGEVEGPHDDPDHKSTHKDKENPKLIRYTKYLGGGKTWTERELEGGLIIRWEQEGKAIQGFPKFETFKRQRKRDTGKPDIVINKDSMTPICVEVKAGDADGNAAYQLLKYMQEHNTRFGVLAAPGISEGGIDALAQIRRLNRPSLLSSVFVRVPFYRYRIEYYDTTLHNIQGDPAIHDRHLESKVQDTEET